MRPPCQTALDAYFANPQGAAYLMSEILEKRLAQLFRRIADGEELTVSEAADHLFLPVEVFRHVWAAVLSTEHEAFIGFTQEWRRP
jgi:ribose 5-phosphate isomerase